MNNESDKIVIKPPRKNAAATRVFCEHVLAEYFRQEALKKVEASTK